MSEEQNTIPPGLRTGGSWLPVIRAEIRKEITSLESTAIVLQEPPLFLRWLLKPWLRPSKQLPPGEPE